MDIDTDPAASESNVTKKSKPRRDQPWYEAVTIAICNYVLACEFQGRQSL